MNFGRSSNVLGWNRREDTSLGPITSSVEEVSNASCVEPAISVRGVVKRFVFGATVNEASVLDGVDLDIPTGQFICLLGPTGCGKSTLLSLISGLQKPTAGVVKIFGSEVTAPRPRDVAVVFQDHCLLPWRTALGNVLFALEERKGVSSQERNEVAHLWLSRMGLSNVVSLYPGQLSGGMRQRVAIARAMVANPSILLLDEPFGALDEQVRLLIGLQLLELQRELGQTAVFVTHSVSEALMLSDRIIVMGTKPGRIIGDYVNEIDRPRSALSAASQRGLELGEAIWEHLRDEYSDWKD